MVKSTEIPGGQLQKNVHSSLTYGYYYFLGKPNRELTLNSY